MDISAAIKGRRSIRKYIDKDIPKELLEEIIDEALWAPSGENRQRSKIIVLANEEKNKLLKIFDGTERIIRPRLEKNFKEKIVNLSLQAIKTAGGAPVVLLFYTPTSKSIMKNENLDVSEAEAKHYYDVLSVAAVVQNLVLSAYSRGLGTCWMTAQKAVEENIAEYTGMVDHELVSIVSIGYPDQSPAAPPRKSDVVKWLGF